ncbi:MAG: hypothetical protein CMJ83_02975 [Planctomycetes bacterium]|nr:hypothetical protein [Planctomycetota bacterium]
MSTSDDHRETPDDLIGRRLGREGYIEIRRRLGQGGIGTVYEAWDHNKARSIALKFLRTDHAIGKEMVLRFQREGRRFRELRHPNVVRVLGLGQKDGLIFIASEYVDGRNLAEILDERGSLQIDEALGLCQEIARGLDAAHAQRIVHRDMKPENVMIRTSDGAVKVVDFGIAKVLDSQSIVSQPGVYLGTPGYSAPEQIKGDDVDCRADIFALGAILYELLTGRIAFRGRNTVQILRSTTDREPISPTKFNDSVVRPVAKLISSMIEKNPRRRPKDMTAVIDAIDRVRNALSSGRGSSDERRGIRGVLRRVFEGIA